MCEQVRDPRIQPSPMLVLLLLLLNFGAHGANLVRTLPGYPGELPFTLETGYVGVGEHEKVQLFYYFVESQRDPVTDPVILWLTGGPGCSALSGLLYEIGPFQFDYKAYNGSLPPLMSNPHAFTQIASVIFLDAPVGTGFSYSETDVDYYVEDDIFTADANHQFLRKWLLDHPKFLSNPLYVSGDSYSGKIVPILVHQIRKGQEAGQVPEMNLKGYVLGNPATNLNKDTSTSKVVFIHRLGFISDELYESAKVNCGGDYLYPGIHDALCLKDQEVMEKCIEDIPYNHVLEPNCNFAPEVMDLDSGNGTLADVSIDSVVEALQGKKSWCRTYNYVLSYVWANDPEVREALHVRKGTIDFWRRCNNTLHSAYNTMAVSSVVDYHRSFFNSSYRALIYSGDHDMVIPYVGTTRWIVSLNLTVSDPWRPWYVDNQVAGFTKKFGYEDNYELTFATVKGAGHTAPEYKPKQCLEMLDRWLDHCEL